MWKKHKETVITHQKNTNSSLVQIKTTKIEGETEVQAEVDQPEIRPLPDPELLVADPKVTKPPMKIICHPDCEVRKINILSIIMGEPPEADQIAEVVTKGVEEIKEDKLHTKVLQIGILHQLKAIPEPEITRISRGRGPRGLATKLDTNSTMIKGM